MSESERQNSGLTTVGWELLVAVSGVALVLFIVAHLAGNILIFLGPAAFNAYSERLHALGPLLWAMRVGLIAAFCIHVIFTVRLWLANRAARKIGYAARRYRGTNFIKLTMIYTGIIVFVFVYFHLRDFTFRMAAGSIGTVAGQDLGLFGLEWNAFGNPVRALLYIVAVWSVGLHFSNAVSTIWVTLGMLSSDATEVANWVARIAGFAIATAFTTIPVYVLVRTYAGI